MHHAKLQMILAYDTCKTCVDEVFGEKYWRHVVGSKGCKLLEDFKKFGGDIVKLYPGVDGYFGNKHVILDGVADNFLKTLAKSRKLLGRIERPAAYLCPPKCSSKSKH